MTVIYAVNLREYVHINDVIKCDLFKNTGLYAKIPLH